jgi:hypothetical protein
VLHVGEEGDKARYCTLTSDEAVGKAQLAEVLLGQGLLDAQPNAPKSRKF